jgi:riboflavin kinase/FMN adenylyltransferase
VTSSSNSDQKKAVMTIGVFDGVHRGHRALIGKVVKRAEQLGVRSVCVTFTPHPQEVLNPGVSIPRLTTLEDRIALIKGLGVSDVLLIQFSQTIAQMSPEEFIARLNERFSLIELWVGSNFALGRGRVGTPDRLALIGSKKGFSVHSFPRVEAGAEAVSSSRIRTLLSDGHVAEAAELLCRYYSLKGNVVSGDRRGGASLGFATANLEVAEKLCVPRDGVYAVHGWVGKRDAYSGVCNIGFRPTFNGHRRQVEAHLIGFQGDLYGKEISLEFVERLRDERRFQSVEELVAQITSDIQHAERLLSRAAAPQCDSNRRGAAL